MKLGKNRYLLIYILTWGILLIVGSLMVDDMEPGDLVVYTAILALVSPLLYYVSDKVGSNAPAGKTYTVYRMGDAEPVCRVEGMWIYRGTEDKATWYLRDNKIFAFAQKEYLYRFDKEYLYRRGESEPCMMIQRDTVYSMPDQKPLYQTVE